MNDYADFVETLFCKKNQGSDGVLHAAIGIAGECGEVLDLAKKLWVRGQFDRGVWINELGDVEFYAQALATRYCLDWPHMAFASPFKTTFSRASTLYLNASMLYRDVNDSTEEIYRRGLEGVYTALDFLYADLGVTRGEVRAANMVKLKKRFPNGYTDEAAIAQLDKG